LDQISAAYLAGELSEYHWVHASFEKIEEYFYTLDHRSLIDRHLKTKLISVMDEICRVMFETHQIEVLQETKDFLVLFIELLLSCEGERTYPKNTAKSYQQFFQKN